MLFDFFGANRLECAEADIERYFDGLNSPLPYLLQNFGREMQASRWSGDGVPLARKNGLVAPAI